MSTKPLSEKKKWEKIHKILRDILQDMRYYSGRSEGIELAYSATVTKLRTNCVKLLNTIDQDDEFRWE